MKTFTLNLILMLFLLGTSCSDSNDNDQPTPTSANISGSVNLFDDGVTEIDNSNMTVSVEGSSISATTNASGQFTLSNVPFGTITIVYEKSGYGTYKKFNINHNGGDTFITETPSLGQTSTTRVTNLNVSQSNNTITIATSMIPEANVSNTRYLRYFFSSQSNVSNENSEAVLETLPAQINPYNLNLDVSSLNALGFTSGQTIYVKCYGESFWSNQYDDPQSETTIFPNLNQNTVNAIAFNIP